MDKDVLLIREDKPAITVDIWEVDSDLVNPSGMGLEFAYVFQTIDEEADCYMAPDEPVVYREGCLLLCEGEYFHENDEFMVVGGDKL